MDRRQALRGISLAALGSPGAWAQVWPERPIRLIVPYPPGGNTDIVGRLYAQKLSERLKQPVVIDNRGGAAGTLGVSAAVRSPADGYTLVVGDSGSLVIAAIANPALTYAPLKDLVPISLVTAVSIVVCVKPDSPVRDLADLIARARAQPGNLTLGTAGVGSPSHLAYELLSAMTGVKMLHVPYKGGAPLTVAAIAGEIDVMIDGAAFAQVKSGRLRAIAVTGPRLSALPGVPSIGEFVKGFEFTNWWGILAPAGAPPDVVRMLNLELSAIAAMPEVEERLTGLGLSARSSSPEQFGDFLRAEIEKIGGVVKSAGIKLN